jgi:glycosyltransferase involved in cell wall biosynthesis
MKRILVIPDSIWGNDSGHRSTQFLVKTLRNEGFDIGVFAEDTPSYSSQRDLLLVQEGIHFFSKKPYRFTDQFFFYKKKAISEFKKLLIDFEPDLVFYFGTIGNKVSIDYLNSTDTDIPYVYLPLTNEFWCLKNFAGLKNGECYKCMNQNFIHAFTNKCLDTNNPIPYLKKIVERFFSKNRFLNAKAVLGYSKSQIDTFKMYGLPNNKTASSNIFFETKSLEGITSNKGDYYLVSGQLTDAKGWHLIPELLKLNSHNNLKFKFIIYNADVANNFINKNDLQRYIKSKKLEVVSGLESHKEVLNLVGNSLAVIIPSNYPSTGEFALLEAMGLKKPVVAFNVGAHRDFLVDGNNSLVSSPLDLNKMTKDLEILYKDEGLWEKLSKNSRTTFEEITNFNENYSIIKSLNL